jgi:hypothetical protein
MRAFSTCNGGVIFVADTIERMEKPVSYKDLVKDIKAEKSFFSLRLFGKDKKTGKQLEAA